MLTFLGRSEKEREREREKRGKGFIKQDLFLKKNFKKISTL
jgi:hypothetical protein